MLVSDTPALPVNNGERRS